MWTYTLYLLAVLLPAGRVRRWPSLAPPVGRYETDGLAAQSGALGPRGRLQRCFQSRHQRPVDADAAAARPYSRGGPPARLPARRHRRRKLLRRRGVAAEATQAVRGTRLNVHLSHVGSVGGESRRRRLLLGLPGGALWPPVQPRFTSVRMRRYCHLVCVSARVHRKCRRRSLDFRGGRSCRQQRRRLPLSHTRHCARRQPARHVPSASVRVQQLYKVHIRPQHCAARSVHHHRHIVALTHFWIMYVLHARFHISVLYGAVRSVSLRPRPYGTTSVRRWCMRMRRPVPGTTSGPRLLRPEQWPRPRPPTQLSPTQLSPPEMWTR